MTIDRPSLLANQLTKIKLSTSRTSMQIKTSKIFNIALTVATLALALNAYQMKQQLDDQIQGSSKSVDKINASVAAIKAHEVELEAKDVAMSALVADLIIKTQEQGQSIDELVAKQTKKK